MSPECWETFKPRQEVLNLQVRNGKLRGTSESPKLRLFSGSETVLTVPWWVF